MTEPLFAQFATFLAAALMIPAVVFFAHGLNHRTMRFWRLAAAGYLALLLGAILGALRDHLPVILYGQASNILFGLGYFLNLQSLRQVKDQTRLSSLDWVIGLIYIAAAAIILVSENSYTNRVALVSFGSAALSLLTGVIALQKRGQVSPLGDGLFVTFSAINVVIPCLRGAAALSGTHQPILDLTTWDPIFFVWSIAAVFCFAIALFLNGTAALALETKRNLIQQRETAQKLADALEGQRNLQKLILHEVKRPLNAIAATIQVAHELGAGMTAADISTLSGHLNDANSYLVAIGEFEELNELLDSPDMSPISISTIAADIANKWGLTVECDEIAKSERIIADPLMMDIALGNMIENAKKFGMTRQGILLRIARDGAMVTFDVIDDGPGVPPSEWDKIFGKFYKVGGASANALKGCGLGLYVVQRIATAHQGYCKVLSQSPSSIRLGIPAAIAAEP